jgi:hypothetical protein
MGTRQWVRRGLGVRELWHLRAVPGLARRFRKTMAACGAVVNRGEPLTECQAAYDALQAMDD